MRAFFKRLFCRHRWNYSERRPGFLVCKAYGARKRP